MCRNYSSEQRATGFRCGRNERSACATGISLLSSGRILFLSVRERAPDLRRIYQTVVKLEERNCFHKFPSAFPRFLTCNSFDVSLLANARFFSSASREKEFQNRFGIPNCHQMEIFLCVISLLISQSRCIIFYPTNARQNDSTRCKFRCFSSHFAAK